MSCPFCNIPKDRVIVSYRGYKAIYDDFPVTEGHALIIPPEHRADFFDLSSWSWRDLTYLMWCTRNKLFREDHTILGFNVGINCGEVAGQTIPHAHIHLIPRREGDHPNPRGGVRAVIPGKADY